MHTFSRLTGLGILLAALSFGAQAVEGQGQAGRIRFSVDARPLRVALNQWAEQAGLSVVFPAGQPGADRVAVKVDGVYSPQEALDLLLKGSGLTWAFVDGQTVAIRAKEKSGRSSGVEGQMRVAEGDGRGEIKPKGEEENDDTRQVVVKDNRIKPFGDANVDLPRGVDDAQPYYIFNKETIDRSGASSVEEFLRQRVTMNTTAMMASQDSSDYRGNISTINLRGLGDGKTLILVNGRRMPGVLGGEGKELQPDLNGIPLSAIDRIEVLPSSASGIYGGSAIGGVVNVVLKQDYSGGEAQIAYDGAFDAHAPRSTASMSYGAALESGRTQFMVNAQWSKSEPMLAQDRTEQFERNIARIQQNSPAFLYSSGVFLGAMTNIGPYYLNDATLTLKNGTVIPAHTYVPAGTSSATPIADLYAGLAADAGTWDFTLPETAQPDTGLLRPIGVSPRMKSLNASLRRRMSDRLEAFLEFTYGGNSSDSTENAFGTASLIPASAPANPFTSDVYVRVVDYTRLPLHADSTTRSLTGGLLYKAPRDWTIEFDYTASDNRYATNDGRIDTIALNSALGSGQLNPFVDTQQYPLDLAPYSFLFKHESKTRLQDFALRGAGPAFSLPWGHSRVAVGLEHRKARNPASIQETIYPVSTLYSTDIIFLPTEQTTDSVYAETEMPLVAAGHIPLLYALELQVAGRVERFNVESSNQYGVFSPSNPAVIYYPPDYATEPLPAEKTSYGSHNYTLGFKYKPSQEVTVRVSQATAFLPPRPDELMENPNISYSTAFITSDPLNPDVGFMFVPTIAGGNPDLRPQHSKSFNAGMIWEPRSVSGLRLDAEFYRIEQFDAITALSAQTLVDHPDLYPGRVQRDANDQITLVDTSLANLFHQKTSGWDLSADYAVTTSRGQFAFHAVESVIQQLKTQYAATAPAYDAAGFHPAEGGAPKEKRNVGVTWDAPSGWNAGWNMQYVSSYRMLYVAGGPTSLQSADGAVYLSNYIDAAGSDHVPSQLYHDLFVGYNFTAARGMLDGTSIRLGIRNVFGKEPPLDPVYAGLFYFSPYGDFRLRTFWLTARKSF